MNSQFEIKLPESYLVWDKDKWTRAKTLIRHKQHKGTKMVMTRSRDNAFIVSQDNHPHMLYQNKGICNNCSVPYRKTKAKGYYECPNCSKVPHKITHEPETLVKEIEPKDIIKSKFFASTNYPQFKKSLKKPYLDAYLLGTHLAEGSTSGYNGSIYSWTITQNPGDLHDIYLEKMSKYGNVSVSGKDLTISKKEIAEKVRTLYGRYSWQKKLPSDFINYSKEDLCKILCGYIDGDGAWVENKERVYVSAESTSLSLVQQLSLILTELQIKHAVSLSSVRDLTRHQSYTLKIFPSLDDIKVFKYSYKINTSLFPKRLKRNDRDGLVTYVKEVMFDSKNDYVYDIETESHTLTVGRMWTHNTGGAVKKGDQTASFPRLEQLLKIPEKLSGKATLAPVTGTITSLSKNNIGGWDVKVNNHELKIDPGRKPVIKEGDRVKKGDRLSDGVIQPKELGRLKDHLTAQQYIVDEIGEIYGDGYSKKSIETVLRGISDNAEITEVPDDQVDLFRGDKTSISFLKKLNKEREHSGLEPIKFKPYFKSIDTLNVDSDDWLTRVTTNRVKDGLAKGMAKMTWGDVAGRDPIPAYIYGDDFGLPGKKRDDGEGFY